MRAARVLALLLALAGPAAALASDLFQADAGEAVRLAAVLEAGSLRLDDGRTIRLAAIHVPRSRAADVALEALLGGGKFRLVLVSDQIDRYGRQRAHVIAADGRWAQGFLVTQGLARVDTQRDERQGAAELLALEDAARLAGRGLWSRPEYQLRQAGEAERFIDTFQIVQGRVASIERKGGRVKLIFDAAAGRDFAAFVAPAARRLFTEAGLDLPSFDGKMLRIRGWIKYRNGAFIDVTHPEQIEVLER